jgi:hypothetical protein
VQPAAGTEPPVAAPPTRVLAPGASVVLRKPRRLRGTIGIVRRWTTSGWEVEIRSAEGTPLHLTLPERALHLR